MSSRPLDSFSACRASLASRRSDAVKPAALQACLNCLMSRFRVIAVASLALLIYLDLGMQLHCSRASLFALES
jgi:hypothetical protein